MRFFAVVCFSITFLQSVRAERTINFLAMSRMTGQHCWCHVVIRNISQVSQKAKVIGGVRSLGDAADAYSFVSNTAVADVNGFITILPNTSQWFGLTGNLCDRSTNDVQECYGRVIVKEDIGALQATGYLLLNDLVFGAHAYAMGRNVDIDINGGRPF